MDSQSKHSTSFHRTRRLIEVFGSRGKDIDQTAFCEECHLQIHPGSEITAVRAEGRSGPDALKVIHSRCANGYEALSDAVLEEAFDEIYGKRTADQVGPQRKKRRNP